MSDAELNPVASSEISVASEENPPIDADVAFLTDQLIASIESLVESNRSIDDEPIFLVESENDGKGLNSGETFVADDDFQSKITSDADGVNAPSSAADDETINDPLMKKLIENFSPTDVPHTYTNRKTGRIELRVKSSEWIREKILQMLNSNVNPDRFIKNVERNFGSKMLPLILEPNEFVQELVRALDGLEKNSRPYYLMCLMTEYCSAWPTKYHAPSPVFRPADVETGHSDVERRPNLSWRGRGQKFNSARNNLAFFHDQQKKPPPTKIAEDWEKYVWNQRPPTSTANVGDRRDEHFRQTYEEPQPLFPPSRYDNRSPDGMTTSYGRSRSPLTRFDERFHSPPDRINFRPTPTYDDRRRFDGRFDGRFQNGHGFRSAQTDYRPSDYRYGSFSRRPDYSSGYGSDWCSREDVERNYSQRPY